MQYFFDLDGTLIDVSKRHFAVYHDVVVSMGGMPLEASAYWRLKRKKTPYIHIHEQSRLPRSSCVEFLRKFVQKVESPTYLKLDRLFSTTIPTLQTLRQRGFCMYLVSYRSFSDRAYRQLRRFGIQEYFSNIHIGRSEKTGVEEKVIAIRAFSSHPFGAVIGDTEDDIFTAKKLGLASVAVLSGIRSRSSLEKCQPDYIIRDIRELLSLHSLTRNLSSVSLE